MYYLGYVSNIALSRPKNHDGYGGPNKNKWKERNGVATIIFYEKLWKNQENNKE